MGVVNPYLLQAIARRRSVGLTYIDEHPTLMTDLKAYYSFEADATDDHGMRDLDDVAATHGVGGWFGNCYSFNGVNQYLRRTITDMHSDPFSVSFWVYLDPATANCGLLSMYYNSSSSWGVFYDTAISKIRIYDNIGGAGASRYSTACAKGAWHHVIAIHTGTAGGHENILWLNGVKVGSGANSSGVLPSNLQLFVGAHGWIIAELTGKMDEIGVWKKTLTDPECLDLWNAGAGLPYSDGVAAASSILAHATLSGGLTSYYDFAVDEGDLTSNHFHLNDNVGAVQGTPGPVAGSGYFSFNGGDRLHRNSSDQHNGSDPITIAVWYYNDGVYGGNGWAAGFYLSVSEDWGLWHDDTVPDVKIYNDIHDANTSLYASASANTTWHLAVMTIENAAGGFNQELWLDGIKVGTGTAAADEPDSACQFYVGRRGTYNDWEGDIGPVGIWNRVLTDPEIADLWNSGAGMPYYK